MEDNMDHEFPSDDLMTKVIRYGLYFGALFQIVCIGAVIFLKDPDCHNDYSDTESEVSPQLTPKRSHHRSRRTDRKQKKR